MATKKGLKKKVKGLRPTVASSLKKTTKKGTKGSVSQSVVVNINKGKKTTSQPSNKPTIASSIASLANVIRAQDFYKTPQPVSPLRETIKSSVATQVEEPMRKSIAVQSEEPVAMKIAVKKPVKTSLELKPGRFNIPSGEPVNLKLPPQKKQSTQKNEQNERKQMRHEEMLSIITQPSKKAEIPLQTNKRRNKQEMNEARQMGREDIASIQLGLTKFNNQPATEISDTMSEVSTTPLYEGGRVVSEPPIKRSYIKSGKFSKKQPKQSTLIPVVMREEKDTFYPTKPSTQLSAKFEEPEPLY